MNYDEALFNLRYFLSDRSADSFDIRDEIKSSIIALSKQVGKVPNVKKLSYAGVCSDYGNSEYSCVVCNCGLRYTEDYKDSYCPNCGQAVKWESVV